jgi:energy-coupling factor transporter ATP-binding protein EcfA2
VKIDRLLTWHWGSLEDREWPFADTVLLTGESGSGKSTLLDAIQTVLTAAHQHLVQFNIGQDESTRAAAAARSRARWPPMRWGSRPMGCSCAAARPAMRPSCSGLRRRPARRWMPFTALVGVEALEDGRRAVLQGAPHFFIVRHPLTLDHLARRGGEALAAAPLPLKELYVPAAPLAAPPAGRGPRRQVRRGGAALCGQGRLPAAPLWRADGQDRGGRGRCHPGGQVHRQGDGLQGTGQRQRPGARRDPGAARFQPRPGQDARADALHRRP